MYLTRARARSFYEHVPGERMPDRREGEGGVEDLELVAQVERVSQPWNPIQLFHLRMQVRCASLQLVLELLWQGRQPQEVVDPRSGPGLGSRAVQQVVGLELREEGGF